jgi:DNA-directed RNA polymerase specialized sigma subunit
VSCLNADSTQKPILRNRRAGPASRSLRPTGDRFTQSPSAAADPLLLLRQHRNGDGRAREELIRRTCHSRGSWPVATTTAASLFDDLLQVARLGLVKAAGRFDVERSTSFASFAVPTILGELRRHLRDTGWAMRVPRPLRNRCSRF